MVRLLLANGADPTVVRDDRKTALWLAIDSGRTQIASMLKESSARE